MSDKSTRSSSESSTAAQRPPLDYRRIEVVDPQMAEIYRGKTVTQRIQMLLDANATMRLLIAGTLQTQHPEWNGQTINREVAKRMLNAHHSPG